MALKSRAKIYDLKKTGTKTGKFDQKCLVLYSVQVTTHIFIFAYVCKED